MNFIENIVLENDRVRLEPLDKNHLSELLPIAIKHPDLLQYSPSPFGTPELLEENISKAITSRIDKQRYPFAIFDKLNNRFVGSTSFGNISTKDKRLEIGWTWIDKESQGIGLNKYCKHLLLSYAFEKLIMQRVEFKTDNRNNQSKKAIGKIGGTFEGILRSHTVMRNGYRRDTAYYSILKHEWDSINNTIFKEIKTAHNKT
jgi:RimJ/RimL family protein N-acetyltransferase